MAPTRFGVLSTPLGERCWEWGLSYSPVDGWCVYMNASGKECALLSNLVVLYVDCVARVNHAGSGSACSRGLWEGIDVLEHLPTGLDSI